MQRGVAAAALRARPRSEPVRVWRHLLASVMTIAAEMRCMQSARGLVAGWSARQHICATFPLSWLSPSHATLHARRPFWGCSMLATCRGCRAAIQIAHAELWMLVTRRRFPRVARLYELMRKDQGYNSIRWPWTDRADSMRQRRSGWPRAVRGPASS